MKIKVHQYQQN